MGTIISNLKARFGVDTADFRKGLKDGEKALTDFKEAGSSQIADFASLFGINMSAVSGALSTVGKALNYVGQSFKAAKTGGDAFAISMKGVRAAMMATGIGALIVALGSLIAYFRETEIGAKQLASGMSQVKAVWESVKDRFASFGSSIVNAFTGNWAMAWEDLKRVFDDLGKREKEAGFRAKETAQLIYDLTRQERQLSVTKSEQLVLIDQLRLKSRDLELTAQERLDALTRAAEIEKRFNKEAIDIASQRILIAQANLQNDQDDEELKNALAQAYVEYNQTLSESIQFEYSLTSQKNALIKEIRAQLEAQKELNQASKISGTEDLPGVAIDAASLVNMSSWQGPIAGMREISQAAIDMGETVNDSLRSMVAGMGEWFGAFASGMATVRDGRQMVGNALGDMLITLGRVAINTGIGIEAIKKAFASLGGIGAIAAGTALIAFGSSIKGSIASINQSRTSAMEGTSIPGSAGSIRYAAPTTLASAGNGTLKIEGTARLVLSGADLLALLNNENTRISIVT